MRATRTLLAKASTVGTPSGGLGVVPHALLPPIPLYRRLLRGHRKHLPPEMRVLGDEYVKAEFRAHRGVDNPIHIVSTAARGGGEQKGGRGRERERGRGRGRKGSEGRRAEVGGSGMRDRGSGRRTIRSDWK